jgi:hypothetical protein
MPARIPYISMPHRWRYFYHQLDDQPWRGPDPLFRGVLQPYDAAGRRSNSVMDYFNTAPLYIEKESVVKVAVDQYIHARSFKILQIVYPEFPAKRVVKEYNDANKKKEKNIK